MSGRKIIEGLEEAVAMARALPPTDAEVEAMAERLWDIWRAGSAFWAGTTWSALCKVDGALRSASSRQRAAFRAMARTALEKRDDG